MTNITYIPIEQLHPHPDNPRKELKDLSELADSIKANGVFQNLTIVPRTVTGEITGQTWQDGYTVIIGHRRLAAAKLAGLSELPCVVTEMTPQEQIRTMLMENMQRADLTVYEQAQGFQAMIDLGDTVETVAWETGFSTTTVRRRLKMMELDQDKLKEVSTRQLSITDFDELSKIENIKARNECLEKIGTPDFGVSVRAALRHQQTKKKTPLAIKQLKAAGAKPIRNSERYSSKYDEMFSKAVYLYEWDGLILAIPKVKDQLYYHLDGYGGLRFFTVHKRAEPRKRSQNEIEKEKRISETWAALDEKASVAYELRSNFVDSLSFNSHNAVAVLRGAIIAATLEAVDYNSPDRAALCRMFGIDTERYDSGRGKKALTGIQGLSEKEIPKAIYALFGDSKDRSYSGGYKKVMPNYVENNMLDGLYLWLTGLGYEMSIEELALQDGTHELFHVSEVESDAD